VNIARVALKQGGSLYLRDPRVQGKFLVGVECDANGVGVRRDGCTEDPALMIRRDRIRRLEPWRGET